MGSTTWPQGNTHALLPITLQNGSGASANPVQLVNVTTITLSLQAQDTGMDPQPWIALAGTATITDAANGQFTYKFAASDVATPGTYLLVCQVLYTDTTEWRNRPFTLIIEETM